MRVTLHPYWYNRLEEVGGRWPYRYWTECECGWKTRKRKRAENIRGGYWKRWPFYCPVCGTKLSDETVCRGKDAIFL